MYKMIILVYLVIDRPCVMQDMNK